MKYFLYTVLALCLFLLIGCPPSGMPSGHYTVPQADMGHIFFRPTSTNSKVLTESMLSDHFAVDDRYDSDVSGFAIGDDIKPYLLADRAIDNSQSITRDTYRLSIISTSEILDSCDMHIEWTNAILNSMKSGFLIDTEYDSITLDSIDLLNTNGSINTDNIIAQLDKLLRTSLAQNSVESLNSVVVLLFNDSDFFNTANAIAINHGEGINKRHYIFGDAKLLVTPMIFLHELGHAFNLTHANDTIQACGNMYNIMHESNIGCTAGFTARQLAMMSIDKYIDITEEVYYPKIENCHCGFTASSGEVEEYLNSIDRNIDDTPLVGDFDLLYDQLKKGPVVDTNYLHFKYEFDRFIKGPDSIKLKYVTERTESHQHLRKNNLLRWLNHNRESVGLPMKPLGELSNSGDSIFVAVQEYKDRSSEIGSIECSENRTNCESRLACLKNKESNMLSRIEKQESSIKDLREVIAQNKDVIVKRNNQIRELQEFIQELRKDNPSNSEILQVEEKLKILNRIKPNTISKYKGK